MEYTAHYVDVDQFHSKNILSVKSMGPMISFDVKQLSYSKNVMLESS